MLRVERIGPGLHEVTMEGLVDRADVETLKGALDPVLKGDERASIVIRAETWSDMTADAIRRDARWELGMMPRLGTLARLAFVSDKQAFAALIGWADRLLPGTEMRAFPGAEAEEARRWAAEAAEAARAGADGPGLRMLEDGSHGLVAYEIVGRLTKEDVERAFAALDRAGTGGGKVDLLAVVRDWDGFRLSVLGRDLFRGKLDAVGKVRRYAIVGAPAWMGAMAQLAGPVVPISIRTFDAGAEAEARGWLAAP